MITEPFKTWLTEVIKGVMWVAAWAAVGIMCLWLIGCATSINGHPCEPNSRNMDCMLMEGRL